MRLERESWKLKVTNRVKNSQRNQTPESGVQKLVNYKWLANQREIGVRKQNEKVERERSDKVKEK